MDLMTRPVRPDPLNLLPPRARRTVGRHHQPPVYGSTTDRPAIADGSYGAFAGVRSVVPTPIVTFGRKRLTFMYLSAKTGTTQEGEGPGEYALAKELEVNPLVPAYQMHGSRLEFDDTEGGPCRRYGPDAVYWSFETGLTMAEVKANEAWFAMPDVRAMSDRASRGLAGVGIAFAEVSAAAMQEDRRRAYNVSRAFADRATAFSDGQLEAIENLIGDASAPFGRVAETLRVPSSVALQTVNAMMVRRYVAYDLSARIDEDTIVTVPPAPPSGMPDIHRIGH